jgi:hypothetical protein
MARAAKASSIHCVVVLEASEAPMPRLLGEGTTKLPSPLNAVSNSLAESSIMAYHGVDVPLQVEPMKVVPASPLLRERLRPLK